MDAQPSAVKMETDVPTTSQDNQVGNEATATPTPGNKANRKRRKNKMKVGLPSKILETVTTKLKTCKKGEELDMLMNVLQPTINELVNKYSSIKKDLEVVMKQLSPFYDVLVFGSAVTGLAFRGNLALLKMCQTTFSNNSFYLQIVTLIFTSIVVQSPKRTIPFH
jgi:hypothetical protein